MRRLAPVAMWLAACAFDSAVPEGARIRCATDADCPPSLRCQPAAAVCVKEGEFDAEPPALVSGSVVAFIVPGPGNLHPSPLALTIGSEWRVSFSTTEPLGSAPELLPSAGLSCFPRAVGLADFELGCFVPAPWNGQEGDVTFSVVLVDVAGNRAEVPVPLTVSIDTIAPASPDTQTPRSVVQVRAPWGSAASGPAPRVTLEGVAQSAVGADYVAARSGAVVRGLIAANADGSFGPGELSSIDEPGLEAAALDSAGNLSAWVAVRDGRWVASLLGRRPGDGAENPHRIGWVGAQGTVPGREDLSEWGEADGVAAVGGGAAVATGSATWRQIGDPLPSSFGQPIAVYDAERGRVVRFGGVQKQTVAIDIPSPTIIEVGPPLALSDVREWAATGWVKMGVSDPESDGRPQGRSYASAAWDPISGRVLLHGGTAPNPLAGTNDPSAGPLLSDTWAWNGTSWRRLADGPALAGAATFWDETQHRLVVAGGDLGTSVSSATWTFDGTWRALDGGALPARSHAAVAWDSALSTAFLFGGRLADAGVSAETLRFTGSGWAPVAVAGGPAGRSHAAMVFDAQRQRTLLVGGRGSDGGALFDTWAFDGVGWAAFPNTLAGVLPDAGSNDPSVAWDIARRTAVLTLGRRTFTLDPNDSTRWLERSGNDVPVPDYHPPLVCAEPLGGCRALTRDAAPRLTPTGWVASTDLESAGRPTDWQQLGLVWNSPTMELLAVATNRPTYRWSADAGWRTSPGPPFGFGRGSTFGLNGSRPTIAATPAGRVAAWGGPDGGWQDLGLVAVPPNPNPGGLELNWAGVVPGSIGSEIHGLQITASNAIALCPANNCFLCADPRCPIFGPAARTIGARWSSPASGLNWPYVSDLTNLSAVGAISWDPVRNASVLFGGMTLGSSKPEAITFEVSSGGGNPLRVSNADGFGNPTGRLAASMQYSEALRGHVLLGGTTSATNWTYWSIRIPPGRLSHLAERAVFCFVSGAGQACFDSYVDAQMPVPDLGDTWLLSRETERPAALAAFDLSAARLPATTPVTRISVRSAGGGSGRTVALPYTALDGARLMLWRGYTWEELARQSAPAATPATLSGSTANTSTVGQLQSLGAKLHLAVEPLGVNGPGAASLSVDHLELELDYTLP